MTISPNEYRWDFMGLSTEDKPTKATSENVTDGSTYYEVDTSKLYVYYGSDWYEKAGTGGGGSSDYVNMGITLNPEDGKFYTTLTAREAITAYNTGKFLGASINIGTTENPTCVQFMFGVLIPIDDGYSVFALTQSPENITKVEFYADSLDEPFSASMPS